jgi:hypothetical protein
VYIVIVIVLTVQVVILWRIALHIVEMKSVLAELKDRVIEKQWRSE